MILENTDTGEIDTANYDEVIVSHGFDRESTLLAQATTRVEMLNEYQIKGLGILQQAYLVYLLVVILYIMKQKYI